MNWYSAVVVLVLSVFVQDVPFKPSNEFEADVDLQFKTRPAAERPTYDVSGNKIEQQHGMLTFLSVAISSIQSPRGEVRFKAIDSGNKNVASKKISPNTSYRFDMGFIEDLKKGVSPNTITIYFLNDKKEEVNKVVLQVTATGDFLVNGEKRGQF